MKQILYLLLVSCPIFAMQQDDRQNNMNLRRQRYENSSKAAITVAYMMNTPVIRDATIAVAIATASTVPVLVPVAIVVGIGMRIAMSEQKQYQ